MKIKITRDTVANKEPVFVGDVVDLDEQEAKYLIAIGKAEKFVETDPHPALSLKGEGNIETADLKPQKLEKAVKPSAK